MKKPTIIIGKKQIIMTCLTLMLMTAVYINYVSAPDIVKDKDSVPANSSPTLWSAM